MSGSRVALGIVAAVASAAAAHELASILVPLVIAVFLMILVETIARVVRTRAPALPRWFGFTFGILALAAALVGSVWVVGSYAAALAGQAPAVAARIDAILVAVAQRFGAAPMTLDRLVGEEELAALGGALRCRPLRRSPAEQVPICADARLYDSARGTGDAGR